MAIIDCPKCGQKISGRATKCVHCGATIGKKIICEECGAEYPDDKPECPNCGCPTKRSSSKFSSEKEREVYVFLATETDKYPADRYNEVKAWLMSLDDRQFGLLYQLEYRDADIVFLISIFLGYFGVDRLILKDTKNGLMKLAMACLSFLIIPGIVAIVWWVKDLFNIKEMVKLYNYNLMRTVSRIY